MQKTNSRVKTDEGKLFDFNNWLVDDNIVGSFISLTQIGEVALECGGEIFEHTQCCHEITYIVSGEGTFYTNGTALTVRGGDVHVVSKSERHGIKASKKQKLRYICLGFDFVQVPAEFTEVADFFASSPKYAVSSHGDLRSLFEMLVQEFYCKRKAESCAVESIIKLILIKTYREFSALSEMLKNPQIRESSDDSERSKKQNNSSGSENAESSSVSKASECLGASGNLEFSGEIGKSESSESLKSLQESKDSGLSEKSVIQNARTNITPTIYRVVKYIDGNIYEIKSVREIAEALNFTENYLSHMFKASMGLTLREYIRKKRLETAKTLIANRNMSLTDIAALLRFDSVQSLSRAFKREYGKTPSQFAKTTLQKPPEKPFEGQKRKA